MKGTTETATKITKRARRKKRRGRETDPGCDIMFTPNEMEVGVSEVKAAGYDKLLESRVEGIVSSHRLEGVMNRLQVYHPAPRDDSLDRDVCIPKSAFIAHERGDIGPVNKDIGPKKSRAGYAPTKEKIKDDNNNDDDKNEAMDNADPDSKAPRRTAWDMMW